MSIQTDKTLVFPAAPKKPRKDPIPLPFQVRLKVRNLYISQGLQTKVIAERCGLSPSQVQNLVSREKLATLRRNRQNGIIKHTDTRALADLEAFNSELAQQAEEISLGALQRARTEIEEYTPESPRNFQSLTGGIANLVKASRTVRGLDSKGAAGSSDGSTVIFIGALERVGDAAKTANLPAMKQAEQVTDVSVKLIPQSQ